MNKILKIGRITDPVDTARPFYVKLEYGDSPVPLTQPVNEQDLFELINHLLREYKLKVNIKVV